MRWSELDFNRGTWTIPGERPRTTATTACRSRRPRWRSSPQCRALSTGTICSGSGAKGSGDGRRARPRSTSGRASPDWTLHDLRRTCATRLADLSVQPHIVEAILNHQSGHRMASLASTTGRPTRTKSAPRWPCGADHIGALTTGSRARSRPSVRRGSAPPDATGLWKTWRARPDATPHLVVRNGRAILALDR